MPIPLWLPFGLLDRMELAPPRLSDTTEINGGPAIASTLHAQASTECDCHIGAYGTLPLAISTASQVDVAAAGGPVPMPFPSESRATIGTADVGVFGGTEHGGGQQIYRLGFLVPSASRDQPRFMASGRVSDEVLELPRTAGVRLSHSRLWADDVTYQLDRITRFDLGLDVAGQYATDDHARIVHVIPRAGIGTMIQNEVGAVAVESAIAFDPFVAHGGGMRMSAGITGGMTFGWLRAAATLATVRTPDGWSGTLALDLAASSAPRRAEPL